MNVDAFVLILRIIIVLIFLAITVFSAYLAVLLSAMHWLERAPQGAKHPWYVRLAYKILGIH